MNPLTQVKNTQKITAREQAIGITEEGSWHAKYKDSAYVYVGGLPFDLTEGDVLAVFAQYGEVVDMNLVRDKATGKPKGFAFLAYEDQRSTVLAVDNLNGSRVGGRIIKVDHVSDYKRKQEEDEEEKQRKREERGVCYAFQRGECNRGDDCKYSHDEQRNANTGWGDGGTGRGDGGASWKHDQFDGSMKEAGRRMNMVSTKRNENGIGGRDEKSRGVCYAFQRGECNRGDGCRFAHDEQKRKHWPGGGGAAAAAGWKNDQFDGSMKEAGRRINMVSTKRKENKFSDQEENPRRRNNLPSPERDGKDNDKSMKPPDNRRARDDGQRRRDGDDEDRGRVDWQRKRAGDREDSGRDRGRNEDRKDSDRRTRRDVNREGSHERKDPETTYLRDDRGGRREERRDDRRERGNDKEDRSRDVRKEKEGSDRGDDGRDERIIRSRR